MRKKPNPSDLPKIKPPVEEPLPPSHEYNTDIINAQTIKEYGGGRVKQIGRTIEDKPPVEELHPILPIERRVILAKLREAKKANMRIEECQQWINDSHAKEVDKPQIKPPVEQTPNEYRSVVDIVGALKKAFVDIQLNGHGFIGGDVSNTTEGITISSIPYTDVVKMGNKSKSKTKGHWLISKAAQKTIERISNGKRYGQ